MVYTQYVNTNVQRLCLWNYAINSVLLLSHIATMTFKNAL